MRTAPPCQEGQFLTYKIQEQCLQRVNIVCDFDGTIALEDVTDSLLERFADPSWVRIEERWRAGEFGSRECMSRQVSLVNASRAALDRFLDTVEIDPGFLSFVSACERSDGIALNIVSDGIDYAVKRVLANHGLSRLRVQANALIGLPGDRFRLEFPNASAACSVQAGTCKCAIARDDFAASPNNPATLLIGDGTSDFCVASQADFVFAKDRLLAHCQSKAIPHMPFDTFADIERELADVVGGFDASIHHAMPLTETPSDA
jgi:2,3-diketo-5-methylthio-1-phosphopentane phosphatase